MSNAFQLMQTEWPTLHITTPVDPGYPQCLPKLEFALYADQLHQCVSSTFDEWKAVTDCWPDLSETKDFWDVQAEIKRALLVTPLQPRIKALSILMVTLDFNSRWLSRSATVGVTYRRCYDEWKDKFNKESRIDPFNRATTLYADARSPLEKLSPYELTLAVKDEVFRTLDFCNIGKKFKWKSKPINKGKRLVRPYYSKGKRLVQPYYFKGRKLYWKQVGKFFERQAHNVKRGVKIGAEATANGATKAYEATVDAVEIGAKATAKGASAGYEATVNAVEIGAKATAKGATIGYEATVNAVEIGAKATAKTTVKAAKVVAKEATKVGKTIAKGAVDTFDNVKKTKSSIDNGQSVGKSLGKFALAQHEITRETLITSAKGVAGVLAIVSPEAANASAEAIDSGVNLVENTVSSSVHMVQNITAGERVGESIGNWAESNVGATGKFVADTGKVAAKLVHAAGEAVGTTSEIIPGEFGDSIEAQIRQQVDNFERTSTTATESLDQASQAITDGELKKALQIGKTGLIEVGADMGSSAFQIWQDQVVNLEMILDGVGLKKLAKQMENMNQADKKMVCQMMRSGKKIGLRLNSCLSDFVDHTGNMVTTKESVTRVLSTGEKVFDAFQVIGELYEKMADNANCPIYELQ